MSIGVGIRESEVNTPNKELQTTKINQVSAKWDSNQQQKPALPAVTRLLTQERGGKVKEFTLPAVSQSEQPLQKQDTVQPAPSTGQPQSPPVPQQVPSVSPPPTPQPETPIFLPSTEQPQSPAAPQQVPSVTPPATPQPQNPPTQRPQPGSGGQKNPPPPSNTIKPSGLGGVVELTADRQEYDVDKQIVTAEGNVLIRFQNGLVDADRAQVSLPNRIMVAEGNVSLRRGEQLLRGDRLEYYFAQDNGTLLNASGEVNQARTGTDLAPTLSTNVGTASALSRPLSDRILVDQPLQQVTYPGGYTFVFGSGRDFQYLSPAGRTGGSVNHYRFQAERVDFDSEGWRARNVRITNDPFSPPELEVRADTARFRQLEPLVSEITTTNSRLVFDQGLSIPIFQDRRIIDRRPRDPALITFGYDATDRGGLFAQSSFSPINTPGVRLTLTPQYFIQRGFKNGFISPSSFGLRATLDATLAARTTLTGRAEFLTLDPTNLENKTRGSLRLRQVIGRTLPHNLSIEYSYRDRLYNGSLGFQTVQSNFGAVLTSPVIPIGKTGINLNYQGSLQFINSETDRFDLLPSVRTNNRINLTRYQAAASLSRGFVLWRGEGLPATATEGLRYTPVPVVPYLQLGLGTTGVASGYSNGDNQSSLSGTISLQGQFGHFSRPLLDYTGFNLSYTQVARVGASPFLFDRIADDRVLSAGITQQLYGPIRVGFQTSYNLNTGKEISTDYFVEYSRRTYNLILRFNPVLGIGSLSLRINDFNWLGNPGPFDGITVRPVVQGVTQ